MKLSARASAIAAIVAACVLPAGMAAAQQQSKQQESKPQLVTNEVDGCRRHAAGGFRYQGSDGGACFRAWQPAEPRHRLSDRELLLFQVRAWRRAVCRQSSSRSARRDQGKVQLGYYEDHAEWKKDGFEQGLELGAKEDVLVERVESLVYRVTYKGTSVVFALNDVSQLKPPAGAVGPDERVIGPVFDELAVRFFLVYNTKAKVFHYILDETAAVPDELAPSPRSDRLLVGKRTGFAFYRDHRLDRKILVGVFERNVLQNNYFDGPFDQLPDNFIEGETLRQAIVDSDPEVKGKIDRFGYFEGGDSRYAITPYMQYRSENDLLAVHRCATDRRVPAAAYYRCFVMDDAGPRTVGRPVALRELARQVQVSGQQR